MSAPRLLKLLLVLVVALAAGVAAVSAQDTAPGTAPLEVEVAEDATRFVFTTERLYDDGMPQYGTPFVTQGYIYPAGTLNGSNGSTADGEPEFPDLVIGEWTCFGWMIGDGAYTESGAMVVSTQIFQFDEAHGGSMIVTDGFEMADIGVEAARAITAGTGEFEGVSGTQLQTLLGFTDEMAVNLGVRFDVAAEAMS